MAIGGAQTTRLFIRLARQSCLGAGDILLDRRRLPAVAEADASRQPTYIGSALHRGSVGARLR